MASTNTSKTAGEINDSNKSAAEPVADAAVTAETAPEAPNMSDLTGVRYVGRANVKSISAKDLESLGIENPKGDLEFNADNKHFISASEINAATRDWFATQSDFVVE